MTRGELAAIEATRARLRDYPGSSHFFFDIGNSNLLAFFDFPAAGVEQVVHSGVSVYFRDPDGARIELIADPLGEMYGEHVL